MSSMRLAVFSAFFIHGTLFANWVSRIPRIQEDLSLSEGALGIVLLGISIGVLVALSLSGGLVARFGSRAVTITAGGMMCVFLPLLAIAPTPLALWIGLFLFGGAMSIMDVAMNAQAVEVERRLAKPVMSTFHAAYSLGGVAGAVIGGSFVALGFAPLQHFISISLVFAIPLGITWRFLVKSKPKATGESVFQLPPRILWPLGAVAFCAAIGEGAMADWSGVYLRNVVGTSASVAAYGFAAFSLTMTTTRMLGDWLVSRFSAVWIVRASGMIATGGLIWVAALPSVVPSLLGFAAVGVGLAVTIPLAFSAAGNVPGIQAGTGIAGVATIGYAGLLAGPPIIGLIAEATSLRFAFLLLAVLASYLIFNAGALQTERQSEPSLSATGD